jgi:hypothetical protein
MLRQTILSLKGALGFAAPSSKDIEKEGDSGNSSVSNSSEDESPEAKIAYTTTGIVIPAG